MHIGREHDFVLLHEESRGLQPDDHVFISDDLCFALPDAGSLRHGPDLGFPRRQTLRHRQLDLGGSIGIGVEPADPEGCVGEVFADGRLNIRGTGRSSAVRQPIVLSLVSQR